VVGIGQEFVTPLLIISKVVMGSGQGQAVQSVLNLHLTSLIKNFNKKNTPFEQPSF